MTARKRERVRLARSELIAHLSMTADRWSAELAGTEPGCLPPEQWPADDAMVVLCRTYGLTFANLSTLCGRLGAELEGRALRAGWAAHWDPAEGGAR